MEQSGKLLVNPIEKQAYSKHERPSLGKLGLTDVVSARRSFQERFTRDVQGKLSYFITYYFNTI